MKYELAKELKEAGFPQHHILGNPQIAKVLCVEHGQLSTEAYCVECGFVYTPTLEELIEACVHAPVSFVSETSSHWVGAKRFSLLWGMDEGFEATAWDGLTNHIGIGPTPLIAVAYLWLALNPKQNLG